MEVDETTSELAISEATESALPVVAADDSTYDIASESITTALRAFSDGQQVKTERIMAVESRVNRMETMILSNS